MRKPDEARSRLSRAPSSVHLERDGTDPVVRDHVSRARDDAADPHVAESERGEDVGERDLGFLSGGQPAARQLVEAREQRGGRGPPHDEDRLSGSASVNDRFRRIRNGWNVFLSSPWLGRGGASLLRPDFPPHASAHLVYLTLLARYGIVGTLVYAAFALAPLVAIAGRRGPPIDAIVVTAAAYWALVFVSYDVFLSFEIVYLFLGLAWALAGLPVRRLTRNEAFAAAAPALPVLRHRTDARRV